MIRAPFVVSLVLYAIIAAVQVPTAAAQVPTVSPTPGNLVSISLVPDAAKNKIISVGEFANFTATGHYDNGVTKNITQKVDYTSSDPTVAEAPNEMDNKGKVNGVAPGVVTISATDPMTGISSNDAGGVNGMLTVQGALQSIVLGPLDKNVFVGGFVTYTATGNLSDGNTKNLTQKVVYASSDTSVAMCPNAEGNKSRVEAVGVGVAIISATDPVTQIATDAAGSGTLTVRVPTGPTATGRTPTPMPRSTPTLCGDPDDSGTVTVTDGVQVLAEAASLPSDCTPAVCDVDDNGSVTVTDGVLVLRAAAELESALQCP
jgi:Bacterial Ig-like domain (group 2)